MASDDDGTAVVDTNDPKTNHQDWQRQETTRIKRGKHGARLVEPTGTTERIFTVTFRSTGKNINMNRLHHGLVEKIFEAVPGVVFRPTSSATTRSKKSMTTIEQFPTTEIGHGNFFERRQKGKTIEVDHKIHSAIPVKEIKNKIMSYIRPNNIFLEKGELDGVELYRFGYLQGAHPRLINRGALEDKINDAIQNFDKLDEYWRMHVSDWEAPDDLPLVSVYKKEIGWGVGNSRVTSECVTLMAIRPVCVLYKHIMSECQGLLHYDFIPTGAAAMTTADQVKDLLINNNDIQNSVQGISIMGLPEMAFNLEYCNNNQVKTIEQWILHHPGVETIEPTDDSYSDGRWIVVVLRDEYDNVKQWISEIIDQIPALLSDREYGVFKSRYEIFPPALFTNAPLGGKMQKEVHETYDRVMAKKERYTKMAPKYPSNAWQKRTPIFFDATPENFPTLPAQKKNSAKQNNEEANSFESTVKTTMTKTAQTIISQDIDTIVSKIDTVVSQYSQVLDKFIQAAQEQRAEDKKRFEDDCRAREAEFKKYEERREADRQAYERQRITERQELERDRADEKRQSDLRFDRMIQEHKEQQTEMLKLIASIMATTQQAQFINHPGGTPFAQFPPPFYNFPPLANPQFTPQIPTTYDAQIPVPPYLLQPGNNPDGLAAQQHATAYRPQNEQQQQPTTTPHEHATTSTINQSPQITTDTHLASFQQPSTMYPTQPDDQDPHRLEHERTHETPQRTRGTSSEMAGQRRRFDQITSTPESTATNENNRTTNENDWEASPLSETARNLTFDTELDKHNNEKYKTGRLSDDLSMNNEATTAHDCTMTDATNKNSQRTSFESSNNRNE